LKSERPEKAGAREKAAGADAAAAPAHHEAAAGAARDGAGPRSARATILAVCGLALLFRLWTLRDGLPEFLDEAWPFREALEMWGWDTGVTDLNPHRFHYPSLTFYLHFLVQKLHFLAGSLSGAFRSAADYWVTFHTDPTPMVVPARLLGIAFDVAGVGLLVWLGERLQRGAGLLAGLMVALSATLLEATRAIYTDTYMMTFSLAGLALMIRHRESGGRAALVGSVVMIGLATGAKYPAGALLLPLAWILWRRHGVGAIPLLAASAAGVAAVFLITTPYAALDPVTFWRDLRYVQTIPTAGHLGRLEGTGLGYHLGNLLREVGLLGLALVPVSLALTAARARERPDHVALWLALVAFGLPIFIARVEAARYLVAVIPLAVLMAALAGMEIASGLRRRRAVALAVLGVGLLVPPAITGLDVLLRGTHTTQVLARRWFEENAGPDVLIVQEAWAAPLRTRIETIEMRRAPLFQEASDAVRERYLSTPWFRSVQLPLMTVGPGTIVVPTEQGEVEFQLVPHAADFNPLSYDPRLFADADYVVTSSAVRGRFERDSARFAPALRFYRLLDREAQVVARFTSSARITGPEIVVHRVGDSARTALRAFGPVDPLWWAATIPLDSRRAIETRLVPEPLRTGGAPRDAEGRMAAWMRPLGRMYTALVRRFAHPMSVYLLELGRDEPALRFSLATLELLPGDVEACLVYTTAAAGLGRWDDAIVVADRTLAATSDPPPVLRIERVQLLLGAGRAGEARAELESLARDLDPGDPLAPQLADLLKKVGGPR
jgi:hypothetical protein